MAVFHHPVACNTYSSKHFNGSVELGHRSVDHARQLLIIYIEGRPSAQNADIEASGRRESTKDISRLTFSVHVVSNI